MSFRVFNKKTLFICRINRNLSTPIPIQRTFALASLASQRFGSEQRISTLPGYFRRHIVCSMASSSNYTTKAGDQPNSNRLAQEKSPYLLQHAHNPVNWYPWGEEAFNKAVAENKMIFLSIGYSTCHWCHVMERESFESEAIANLLNANYVPIKMDREERPDVDKVYMAFVQRVTGGGGWPLTIFLTPTLEPIYGGTYYPPDDMPGRIGLSTVLNLIAKQWSEQREVLEKDAKSALRMARAQIRTKLSPLTSRIPARDCWQKCYQQINRSFDVDYGGFSKAPKFPQPALLNFLFYMHYKYKHTYEGAKAIDMALTTMKRIAYGGIHDHVGSGFARYAVDRMWLLPHFEKMLYDQAQLASAYVDAFLLTKDEFYSEVVEDILLYVNRDLSHPAGGFFGAQDADSYATVDSRHKQEGAYYTWTMAELRAAITNAEDLALLCFHYGVRAQGNIDPALDFHHELENKNMLCCLGSYRTTGAEFNKTNEQVAATLKRCHAALFKARMQRPAPAIDTKVVASWNGMMIAACAKAGFSMARDSWVERAVQAAEFIKQHMTGEGGSLLRCCYAEGDTIQKGDEPIAAFLDDYAYMIRGLIALYEASMDSKWLEWAEELQSQQDDRFWDVDGGSYFNSSEDDKYTILRDKEEQDGAEPCGNSVSTHNLLQLAHYLDRPDLREKAEMILRGYSERLLLIPVALPEMVAALLRYKMSPTQVFIAGRVGEEDTEVLLQEVRKRFMPDRLVAVVDPDDGRSELLYKRLKVLQNIQTTHGKPAAYVCRNYTCSLPVTRADQLGALLDGVGESGKAKAAKSATSSSDSD